MTLYKRLIPANFDDTPALPLHTRILRIRIRGNDFIFLRGSELNHTFVFTYAYSQPTHIHYRCSRPKAVYVVEERHKLRWTENQKEKKKHEIHNSIPHLFGRYVCLACERSRNSCNRWDRKKSSTFNSFSFRLCAHHICLKYLFIYFVLYFFFFSLFVGTVFCCSHWVASEQISMLNARATDEQRLLQSSK